MRLWNPSRKSELSALEQKAVKVCAPRGVRHPEKLPPEHAALADRALQRIVDVMEEQVHSKRAKAVLTAAVEIRDELLGPKTKKLEIEGSLEQILVATLEGGAPQTPMVESGSSAPALPPVPDLASEQDSPDSTPLEEVLR